jgi:tRNA-specific 2-thiouridylase
VEGVSFVAGGPPDSPEVEVQIRYRSPPVSSHLAPDGEGSWIVRFDTPQAAVAPGQAAVFYRGDEVLGGGTIAERPAR